MLFFFSLESVEDETYQYLDHLQSVDSSSSFVCWFVIVSDDGGGGDGVGWSFDGGLHY